MSETLTVEQIVERLRPLARPNALAGMACFGIATESALAASALAVLLSLATLT